MVSLFTKSHEISIFRKERRASLRPFREQYHHHPWTRPPHYFSNTRCGILSQELCWKKAALNFCTIGSHCNQSIERNKTALNSLEMSLVGSQEKHTGDLEHIERTPDRLKKPTTWSSFSVTLQWNNQATTWKFSFNFTLALVIKRQLILNASHHTKLFWLQNCSTKEKL